VVGTYDGRTSVVGLCFLKRFALLDLREEGSSAWLGGWRWCGRRLRRASSTWWRWWRGRWWRRRRHAGLRRRWYDFWSWNLGCANGDPTLLELTSHELRESRCPHLSIMWYQIFHPSNSFLSPLNPPSILLIIKSPHKTHSPATTESNSSIALFRASSELPLPSSP